MAGKDIWIRACFEEDLPAVSNLLVELDKTTGEARHFDLDTMRGHFQSMQQQPQVYYNQVADLDGQVVGFISVIFYQTLIHNGGTAMINELVVSQENRGQGIGGRLVDSAHSEALARGMDELEVGVERGNLQALRFYRKTGFDREYVLLGMEFD